MCGIAGLLDLDGAPVERERVERMTRALAHRGPDGCGVFVAPGVGLGHRRLSIVDLEGGAQPMTSGDGSLSITFNGEIFNYVELREDLQARGHKFRTQSDTEVILELYRAYGDDCVRSLNGEWAFALWDAPRRRLLLSRDRAGVRPLFYTVVGRRLAFGSETKALFQNREIERALDVKALDQLFTFWAPLSPRTLFSGVSEVPPGHSLVVADGELRQRAYWRPEDCFGVRSELDERASAERLLELIADATRLRLRADVPVGAYLSGGLDSTVTTAVAARFAARRLRTFCITFDDAALDESRWQEEAAGQLRTLHQACHCTEDDIARVFPDVVWHAERPMLRTAPAPMFLLSRLVRDSGYKVVVTGEGADEVLGGYDIFKEAKIRRFWSASPDSTWRPHLLRRLYPYMPDLQAQPAAYLRAFFRVTPEDCAHPFFSHLPRWELTSRLKRFYSDDLRSRLRGYDAIADFESRLPPDYRSWDDMTRAQYLEMSHLLPGYILSSQGDRVSMAHGVEGRFPFLDHRIIEFGASLPARIKMKGLNEKYVLKRAAQGLVPPSIVRRTKQPYRAPDAASFVSSRRCLPDYARELLSPARLAEDGLFNPAAVDRLVRKARRADALGVKDSMALVGILSTQLVVQQFLRSFPDAGN